MSGPSNFGCNVSLYRRIAILGKLPRRPRLIGRARDQRPRFPESIPGHRDGLSKLVVIALPICVLRKSRRPANSLSTASGWTGSEHGICSRHDLALNGHGCPASRPLSLCAAVRILVVFVDYNRSCTLCVTGSATAPSARVVLYCSKLHPCSGAR